MGAINFESLKNSRIKQATKKFLKAFEDTFFGINQKFFCSKLPAPGFHMKFQAHEFFICGASCGHRGKYTAADVDGNCCIGVEQLSIATQKCLFICVCRS